MLILPRLFYSLFLILYTFNFITILRDFLIKYRPFKCNTNHKPPFGLPPIGVVQICDHLYLFGPIGGFSNLELVQMGVFQMGVAQLGLVQLR